MIKHASICNKLVKGGEMTVKPSSNPGKLLVTGADGFISSHLVEKLVRDRHSVRAFVQYNSFNSWGWLDSCSTDVRGNFEVFAGESRNSYGVKQAMPGCSSVAHLAALITILFSYNYSDTQVDTIVKGAQNVSQAAYELNVPRANHTSTPEVYGTVQFVPITKQHPFQGLSPYSATKITVDQLAYLFYASDLSRCVIGQKLHVDSGWSSW
jgi:nucleoside-diphosphate-sugar epimerase